MRATVVKFIALILALSATISLGFALPLIIEPRNDALFSDVTILNVKPIITALQNAQNKGAHLAIHGWSHEDWVSLSPEQAKDLVNRGIQVFQEADLSPAAFITPYGDYDQLLIQTRNAITSTGLPSDLPVEIGFWGNYGSNWRNMTSFSDYRFTNAKNRITWEQPNYILIHVEDWNPYLKRLLTDYLSSTDQVSVTIRVDDIEVNTDPGIIDDMNSLLAYPKLGYLAYAVIPHGTWRGGDPKILGVGVDWIMRSYWAYFLILTFLPFSFFYIWRIILNINKKSVKPATLLDPVKMVSIVIPAYNEESTIRKTIEHALKQDYSGQYEVIIVNDGSTDGTRAATENYPVKLINLSKNVGKAEALNIGVQESMGDIIVFSDSDSWLGVDALRKLVEALQQKPDVEIITGNIEIDESQSGLLVGYQRIEYKLEQEINRQLQAASGHVLVCPGPLFAVRREVADKIRFSNETVVEDADYAVKALIRDIKIEREPRAVVYTNAPSSLGGWSTQRKRWWYGNLQVWRLHRNWSKSNLWMVFNYFCYPTSILALIMFAMLPFLFLSYSDISIPLYRGFFYTITPIILFTILLIPFFIHRKKLLIILPLYVVIYSMIKLLMVTYVYLNYITKRGVTIRFGPAPRRII